MSSRAPLMFCVPLSQKIATPTHDGGGGGDGENVLQLEGETLQLDGENLTLEA